ncbi:MAG: hypothetical protein V4850_03015 [Myxococcota bacterium]
MRILVPLALLALLPACTSSNQDKAPDDTAPDDTAPPAAGTVALGERCPLLERIGEITIWESGPDAYLGGKVYDRADAWYGPPELANSSCAYHRFSTLSCGTCDAGEVCGYSGECEPEKRAITDAVLEVSVNGVAQTYVADPTTGDLYGTVGLASDLYTLTLSFAGQRIEVPELGLARGVTHLTVGAEGDSMAPGALTATWTPPAEGGRVSTLVPINHHAAGPTFMRCDVDAAVGRFDADAAMLEPLAVVTGLEFQSVDHTQNAAAYTALGCVDVRLGVQMYVGVDWADE